MPGRAERRWEIVRSRAVRRDLTGEDRNHDEDEHQSNTDDRLLVTGDRAPEIAPATVPDRSDHRRWPRRRGRKLVARPDRGSGHLTSRVRGSRNAVATSATRIAVSTATTISRKRPCMSA